MSSKKYYAVKNGRVPGIYFSWDDCKKQVERYSGAIYKSFSTIQEAEQFIHGESEKNRKTKILKQNEASVHEDTMIAYVDGSYNVTTNKFSYGIVVLYRGEEIKQAKKVEDPSLVSMRNVAGEIKGAEMAMRYAIEQGCKELVIYHDYEGIARWCLGEWKTNKEGTKAYKAYYDSIKDKLNVTFKKVKGHSGDKYNDMADSLAKSVIF